jgi:ArsR family transcriptional regulator, lead/cadmium/zinc/bismuth-responsive transcriptional repressor
MTRKKIAPELLASYRFIKDQEKNIESLLSVLIIIGENTRFKIIILLKEHKKLYIRELAEILQMSHSTISHQVSILQRAALLKKKREGQKIACSLLPSKLISDLLKNLVAIDKLSKK